MSSLVAVVDAGAKAVAAAVDAGVAAANNGAPPAMPGPPASTGGLWHEILTAGAGPGAVITAIVVIFGWWVSRRLERFKHELAEDHAKRQLRADYVRGQIDHLYGPLAFFVESSARHLTTSAAILKAYDEYFANRQTSDMAAQVQEMDKVIETANAYVALVVENNKETVKVLRAGWGWLDSDDAAEAGEYLTHVARHAVEFEEKKKLPPLFYIKGSLKNSLGAPSFLPPTFIDRVRRKLNEKQRELTGLTGAETTLAALAVKQALPDAPPAPPAPIPG